MKQYLDQQQPAKLIELGFEKPSSISSVEPIYGMGGISVAKAYTIGELIEILPEMIRTCLGIGRLEIRNVASAGLWQVVYIGGYLCQRRELIDALYEMLVTLKEEGVI